MEHIGQCAILKYYREREIQKKDDHGRKAQLPEYL